MAEIGRKPFVQFAFLLPDTASTNKKVNDRFGKELALLTVSLEFNFCGKRLDMLVQLFKPNLWPGLGPGCLIGRRECPRKYYCDVEPNLYLSALLRFSTCHF